ncbi:hypothetical protein [Halomarina litorea]|uniref:hypothetical protein n=1 Tax=Halomarina litorea TaxID=2961595 RepID=UPI0020C1FADF|nr:hypothetical protein [Halomarina sp. BCD28]
MDQERARRVTNRSVSRRIATAGVFVGTRLVLWALVLVVRAHRAVERCAAAVRPPRGRGADSGAVRSKDDLSRGGRNGADASRTVDVVEARDLPGE